MPHTLPENFQRVRRHDLRLMLAGFLILALGMTYSLYVSWRQASATHKSLCALREDFDARIASSSDLLDSHPNQELIFGIPRDLIAQNLANQQRTRKALSNLRC